ncbi:HAD hydrolase-like protein [Microbacterium sp. H1-D42]|uniref:HAD hydrolase-like protein n=1 Tax=Microbacterium sp. H1-D42 TaxID=2925844 RepID=UPI001F538177|nr:HAD hydrolase-like protein [Microbacterium sp. H1-D42]UNK70832.1 HAD hydrolase-like protein [Microbacterium sp. H1-D42]
MKYTCILWDVDGTIADASAGILPRLRQVFASYGLAEPDADILSQWIGPPMLESFQKFAGMDREQAQEAVARYRALAAADGYAASVDLYPGVEDVLRAVHAADIPQATASTKPENQVQAILDHYELTPLFTAVSGARVGEVGNDDGKAFVIGQALERLSAAGVDVSRPVLIGDRHHDIDGAADHGIPVIFSDWGFGSVEEAEGALIRVSDAQELRRALLD